MQLLQRRSVLGRPVVYHERVLMDPLIPAILMQSPDKIPVSVSILPQLSCITGRSFAVGWPVPAVFEGYDGFRTDCSASEWYHAGRHVDEWAACGKIFKRNGSHRCPSPGQTMLSLQIPDNVTAGYRMGSCTCDCWICAGLNWPWSFLQRKAKPCAH